jgi:hypothetical protein
VDGCHYDYNTKLEKKKTLHPTLLKGFRFLQHLFEQDWSLDPFNMPHKCAGDEILHSKVSLINLKLMTISFVIVVVVVLLLED